MRFSTEGMMDFYEVMMGSFGIFPPEVARKNREAWAGMDPKKARSSVRHSIAEMLGPGWILLSAENRGRCVRLLAEKNLHR